MKKSTIRNRLDDTLASHGFGRRGATWSRRVPGFVDVIDLQVAKHATEVTINAGVLHPGAYSACWGDIPPHVEEAFCTVRTRLGELVHGRDEWWSLEQPEVDREIASLTLAHVLPFLDRMHSAAAMEQRLVERKVEKKSYPPDKIYLAALRRELGQTEKACAMLADLLAAMPSWEERIRGAQRRLLCSDDSSGATS